MRICPRDGTELVDIEVAGMQLDRCPRCEGIWCDPGELEQLQKVAVEQIEGQLPPLPPASSDPQPLKGYMRCPSCDEGRLQGVTITFSNRVRVDRCDGCLGVWLDKSELDAVLAEAHRLAEAQGGDEAAASQHSDLPASHSPLLGFLHRLGGLFRSPSSPS
jgi:Zn-finger nucleic acid-binding protein